MDEATKGGLLIDADRLKSAYGESLPLGDHWAAELHDQLKLQPAWWLAEYIPRSIYDRKTESRKLELGRGRPRTLRSGDLIHESALRRIRESDYAPLNFSSAFLDTVRQLPEVPEALSCP